MTATISEFNLANALDGTEEYEVVQDGVSKRATADQIRTLISAIINEGNVTSIQAGLAADRPTAGTQNRYYISTDAKKIERDTGAAWEVLAQAPSTIGAGDLGFDPATQAELNAHTGNTSNPHGVTKGQVGLGNVLNKAQLARDGSETATGALPMGGFKITGLADPTSAGDAVTQRILGSSSAGEGASLLAYENGLTAQQAFPAIPVDNVKALVDATHLQIDGLQAQLRAFYADTDNGGGPVYWDADRDKADANGGTIIDPDNVGTLSDTALGTFHTQQGTGSGSGCWVRLNAHIPGSNSLVARATASMFGVIADNTTDALPALEAAYSAVTSDSLEYPTELVIEAGEYHLSSEWFWSSLSGDSRREQLRITGYGAYFDNTIVVADFALSVSGLNVRLASGDGWSFNLTQGSSFYDLTASGCGGDGFAFNRSDAPLASGRLYNCKAINNTGDGFVLDQDSANFVNDFVLFGCEAKNNEWGYRTTGNPTGINLIGCLGESNNSGSVQVSSSTRAFVVLGGYLVNNIEDNSNDSIWIGPHLSEALPRVAFELAWNQGEPGFSYRIDGVAQLRRPAYTDSASIDQQMNGTGPHRIRYNISELMTGDDALAFVYLHMIGRRSSAATDQYFSISYNISIGKHDGAFITFESSAGWINRATINSVTPEFIFDVSNESGSFTAGETITGGSSGATAQYFEGSGGSIDVYNINGSFSGGETITGGSSGATAQYDGETMSGNAVLDFNSNDTVNTNPFDRSYYEAF